MKVFLQYQIEAFQNRTLSRFFFVSATLATLLLSTPAKATTGNGFGFNYWPQNYSGCEALTDANWPTAKKKVAADLDFMRSLNAKALRLVFYPTASGFYAGWPLVPNACKNLPEMLQMMKQRGFKVIMAFSNSYVYAGTNGVYHWQSIYGSTANDYQRFLSDSMNWINSVTAVSEGSTAQDAILYYDLQNEYDTRLLNIDYYFRTAYQFVSIPAAKRGISILRSPEDVDGSWYAIQTQLAVLAGSLSHIEFHSYPVVPSSRCPLHGNIEAVYDYVRARFPATTKIVLGEFGRRAIVQQDSAPDTAPYPSVCVGAPAPPLVRHWDEPNQETTELNLITRARDKGIPYYLHWTLWDNSPPTTLPPTSPEAQVYGYGYDAHRPKDVIGGLINLNAVIPNGDMENIASGIPVGWAGNGQVPVQFFVSGGPASTEAATHSYYARVQSQATCQPPCQIWMQSTVFAVKPNTRYFFNSYIRSNLTQIGMNVVQYNSANQRLPDVIGPKFTPSGWSWNQYLLRLQEAGSATPATGWSVTTHPNAAYMLITIGGTPTTAPGILDVDTVSVR